MPSYWRWETAMKCHYVPKTHSTKTSRSPAADFIFPSPCFHLLFMSGNTKAGLHGACPSNLQPHTLRWVIFPHFRTNMGHHLPRPNNDRGFSNFPITLRYCLACVGVGGCVWVWAQANEEWVILQPRWKNPDIEIWLIMISWFFSWHFFLEVKATVAWKLPLSSLQLENLKQLSPLFQNINIQLRGNVRDKGCYGVKLRCVSLKLH